MIDRRRLLGMAGVLAAFGFANLLRMFGRPGLATIRAVDAAQLIGTGMCFGAAIMALAFFLRSSPSK